MKTKTLMTLLLASSCSLTAHGALLDLKSASIVQYQSGAFSAAVACNASEWGNPCSVNLGIAVLTQGEHDKSVAKTTPQSVASEFNQTSFNLQARRLTPDGRQLQIMGEIQSQGLKNRMLISTGSTAFLSNFKLVSCEEQPIESEDVDYSQLSAGQIIAKLNQITPTDALFCDLKATEFTFAAQFKDHIDWWARPQITLRVYHNGRVTLQSYPAVPYFLGNDLGLELQHVKNTSTDSQARALAAATEFSDLLKQYAEVLLLSSQANSGEKDLSIEQFFNENGKRIVTLKKNIEAEIGNFEIIDIFSILIPINQSYDYIKALEGKLNKELTFDRNVRSYGN